MPGLVVEASPKSIEAGDSGRRFKSSEVQSLRGGHVPAGRQVRPKAMFGQGCVLPALGDPPA
eukprot:4243002-Amphidinium_carterae.1